MARPLRIQYPGAVYHITSRGNEKREIFRDDKDRLTFLDILEQSLQTYNVRLYCYALMPNHFHLLVETPLGNLSEFMRQFNITYTSHYNRRHNRVGHLYQGRYKSILVDRESYLKTLIRYIHLNPVKTEEVEELSSAQKVEYLRDYRWSSLPGYICNEKRTPFVDYGMVLEEYGGDDEAGRKAYWKDTCYNIDNLIDIKGKIIGQNLLGSEKFIGWIKKEFLNKEMKKREVPSVRILHSYKAHEEIIEAMSQETGRDAEEIFRKRGVLRQIAMELLYRVGGFKGPEIGEMMGVDYSTVSQYRKRLKGKLNKDKGLLVLMNKIEKRLSTLKI
jgi:REP element-mobilizing transposase RayT